MTDHFEELGEPRRPWLDPERLHALFLARSQALHPDRFHGAPENERREAEAQYTALNVAYQCLREPAARLLHLLTLELGHPPPDVMSIPHETTTLFTEVAGLCREADRFLADRARVTSPLLKVDWFERGQEWAERLRTLATKIEAWRSGLEERLREMSGAWEAAPPPGDPNRAAQLSLARLEQTYRLISYADRWLGQLRERAFQMSV